MTWIIDLLSPQIGAIHKVALAKDHSSLIAVWCGSQRKSISFEEGNGLSVISRNKKH